MKKFGFLIMFAMVFILVGLVSCSPQAATQTTTSQPAAAEITAVATTEAPAVSTEPSTTPTIDVDALIREKLQNHHSLDRIYNAQHTREEWNATLDRMIGYGAKISEEEKQLIIDYLLSR